METLAERASVGFEGSPGQQSQIDWGSSRVHFRHQPVVLHLFGLALGYCRRHFMVRVHGTTHQTPLARFTEEQGHLVPRSARPGFKLEAASRASSSEDFLVSLDTNRYSVPLSLIGHTVEVERRDGQVRIHHRAELVVFGNFDRPATATDSRTSSRPAFGLSRKPSASCP